MEEILMATYGGGIADWNDIAQTKYNWSEILERAKNRYYGEEIDINDLYETILNMAIEEFNDIVEEYKMNKDNDIDYIGQLEEINVLNSFDIWCNCLDTRIKFIGDKQDIELLQGLFEKEIEKINEKIGFTYIDFVEE